MLVREAFEPDLQFYIYIFYHNKKVKLEPGTVILAT
jgi:hypothetical protein